LGDPDDRAPPTAHPGGRGAAAPPRAPIEVQAGELRQLYNSLDPAPFRERDLDPKVETFIVEWARELPRDAPLALVVRLSRETPAPADAAALAQAVHDYFAHAAASSRTQLRRLFRTGRVSLVIGLAFVAAAILIGERVAGLVGRADYGRVIQESVAIGAWVALWRPMEIFLYDWWPIRAEIRLYDRLAAMPVRVVGAEAAAG
jgi:hypothetical protein